MRIRLAPTTGFRRSAGSPSRPTWPCALIGCPPHPVVWQIYISSASPVYLVGCILKYHFIQRYRSVRKCYRPHNNTQSIVQRRDILFIERRSELCHCRGDISTWSRGVCYISSHRGLKERCRSLTASFRTGGTYPSCIFASYACYQTWEALHYCMADVLEIHFLQVECSRARRSRENFDPIKVRGNIEVQQLKLIDTISHTNHKCCCRQLHC